MRYQSNHRFGRACKERIQNAWESRKEGIQDVLNGKQDFNDFALSWDVRQDKAFEDAKEPFDSLCLSWGGPADYIRYYENGKIVYCFQDWFDGAEIRLEGEDYDLARQLHDEFLKE